MWVVALVAFVVGISIYAGQERRDYPAMIAPASPIEPVTIIAAIVLAIVIVAATGGSERDRVTNGVIAALIAPMVFELPFDLVVMSRTYPPVPPNPAFYRGVFFAPLFLLEITTVSLLVLAPGARMSRVAVLTYALMLGVFAGWALLGFAYPSTPSTIAFNVASKLLAFVAVAGLFFPHWFQRAFGRVRRRHPSPA